jgi:GT2 family glycosyltransferase
MTVSPELSIIIVNWNTRGLLRECLMSICAQVRDCSFEILVVDNASSDGSAQLVSRDFPQIQLIANESNLGFARANNQAIERSLGRYILLLNADVLIADAAIDRMLAFMRTHPRAGALGCVHVDGLGNRRYLLGGQLPTLHSCLMGLAYTGLVDGSILRRVHSNIRRWGTTAARATRTPRGGETRLSGFEARQVDLVDGCGFMTRQETLADVGLLDETYHLGSEDADWSKRMKDSGWELWFLEDARIVHYGLQSHCQSDSAALHYCQGEFRFLRQNYGNWQAFIYRVLVPVFMTLGIVGRTITYPLAQKGGQRRLRTRLEQLWLVLRWSIGLPTGILGTRRSS